MEIPTAAIIIIGNEILSGSTVDQNIPFLAKRLFALGIKLEQVYIIGDVLQTIIDTVRLCHQKFKYVFTTGGIGPTHDDITAEAVANAFNTPLESNKEAIEILHRHYGSTGDLNAARSRMALIPKGASLIANHSSAAPGFRLENVFVMAGVPAIAQAMFDEIATQLKPGPKIFSTKVQCMLGEGTLAEELRLIQSHYPKVDIGSYPYFKNKTYGLSLVLRGIQEEDVLQATQDVVALIKAKGGEPEFAFQ
jgi:molybdenum cofactor synthesis domain-containing protein